MVAVLPHHIRIPPCPQMSRALVLLISRQLYVAHFHLRTHVTCNLNQRQNVRCTLSYIASARDIAALLIYGGGLGRRTEPGQYRRSQPDPSGLAAADSIVISHSTIWWRHHCLSHTNSAHVINLPSNDLSPIPSPSGYVPGLD